MIRNVLFGSAALVVLSTAAFAADLPARSAPPVYIPPPVPLFSWTGFYIGGQAGYGFGSDKSTIFIAGARFLGPINVGQTSYAIGGGHLGYNYQLGGLGGGLGGGIVVGVEADIDGSNNSSATAGGGLTENHSNHIEGSTRGRLGLAIDRALFYVTGGAAFTQFQDTFVAPGALFGLSTSRIGWTAGGGVEYAVTPNWSLRAEYRYSDFGTYSEFLTPAVRAVNHPIEERVQVGFSYNFSSPAPAPVVARY